MCGAKGHSWFCLVRVLEPLGVTNEYECPLLSLTAVVKILSPHQIETAVSIIHECTETCTFVHTHTRHRIEREDVDIQRLV